MKHVYIDNRRILFDFLAVSLVFDIVAIFALVNMMITIVGIMIILAIIITSSSGGTHFHPLRSRRLATVGLSLLSSPIEACISFVCSAGADSDEFRSDLRAGKNIPTGRVHTHVWMTAIGKHLVME